MTIIICDKTDCINNKKYAVLPPYENRCRCDAIGINKDGCDSFIVLPSASQSNKSTGQANLCNCNCHTIYKFKRTCCDRAENMPAGD